MLSARGWLVVAWVGAISVFAVGAWADQVGLSGLDGLIESGGGGVPLTGGSLTGALTVCGSGTNDCVKYDDNGAQGLTRSADEAPNDVFYTGENASALATVNTTGGSVYLAAGDGTMTVLIATYTSCATDTVTVTINGTASVLTEGTNWTASVSNASTCASLATAIDALTGVSATCSTATVRVTKDAAAASVTLTTSDPACDTVSNGTDGAIYMRHATSIRNAATQPLTVGTTTTEYLGVYSTTPFVRMDSPRFTTVAHLFNDGANSDVYAVNNSFRISSATQLCFYSNSDASSGGSCDTVMTRSSGGSAIAIGAGGGGTGGSIQMMSQSRAVNVDTLLNTAYANQVINNEGATARYTLTLPALATAGGTTAKNAFCFRFVSIDTDDMKIAASAGDVIHCGATTSASGGFICLESIGDSIDICEINATDWFVTGSQGVVCSTDVDLGCP